MSDSCECPVGAKNHILVLGKDSKCSEPLSHPSRPQTSSPIVVLLGFCLC